MLHVTSHLQFPEGTFGEDTPPVTHGVREVRRAWRVYMLESDGNFGGSNLADTLRDIGKDG